MNSLIWLNKLPDLNRLKTFYSVYLYGGITQASVQMSLTRSAISQSVSLLENELNVSLFKRVNRRLIPTLQGKELFQSVRTIFESLNDQVEIISTGQKTLSGNIRISAPILFAQKKLLPIIQKFSLKNPNVSFNISITDEESLKSLSNDDLDLCFIDSPDLSLHNSTGFRKKLIETEEEALAFSKFYKHKDNILNGSYEILSECNFLSYYSNATDIKHWFKFHYTKHPTQIRVSMQTTHVTHIIEGIKLGIGLGIVPIHYLNEEIKKGTVCLVKPHSKKTFLNNIFLLQQKGKIEGKIERAFVDYFLGFS